MGNWLVKYIIQFFFLSFFSEFQNNLGPECTTILAKPNGQAVSWTTGCHKYGNVGKYNKNLTKIKILIQIYIYIYI